MARVVTGIQKIEGFKELEQALNELPRATGRNVQRRALSKAANAILMVATSRVPVRFGYLKRSLAASRVKFDTSGSAGKRAFHEAMQGGATRAEARAALLAANQAAAAGDEKIVAASIVVGAGKLVQAITQEFGTVNHRPQPFMRPAWDGNKSKIAQLLRDELATEIKKAAARHAKKVAKLAAQIK